MVKQIFGGYGFVKESLVQEFLWQHQSTKLSPLGFFMLLSLWQETGTYDRISCHKCVVIEPRAGGKESESEALRKTVPITFCALVCSV